MKKLLAGVALLTLSATALIAQPAPPPPPPHDMADMEDMRGPKTRADVQEMIKKRFAEADANRDGAITREEAEKHHAAMRDARRAKHFTMLDKDGNGQLSKEEFAAPPMGSAHGMMSSSDDDKPMDHKAKGESKHRHGMMMRHRLGGGDMFAMMDANKDGKVTITEASVRPLAMFDRADTNKDGTVTPEERKAAMEKMMGMMRGMRHR